MTARSNAADDRSSQGEAVAQIDRWVRCPISALSFWSAITLPILYVPLLVSGLETAEGLVVFLGLFGTHLLTLFGGRKYNRND